MLHKVGCRVWVTFFKEQNHFPKIYRSVICKITIVLFCFWDVYDVNLREKKLCRSTAIHAE